MSKKILALLMALVMIFVMMPTAFAASVDGEKTAPKISYRSGDYKTKQYKSGEEVYIEELRPGDTLEYGVKFKSISEDAFFWDGFQFNVYDHMDVREFPEKTTWTDIEGYGSLKKEKLNTQWGKFADNKLMVFDNNQDNSIYLVPVYKFDGNEEYGYGVFVNDGTKLATVTDQNYANVLGDGTVSYDPTNHVLTLENAELTATNMPAIKSWIPNLTIELAEGSVNKLTLNINKDYLVEELENPGIKYINLIDATFGNLTFTGKGALNLAIEKSEDYIYNEILSPAENRMINAFGGLYYNDPEDTVNHPYNGNIEINGCTIRFEGAGDGTVSANDTVIKDSNIDFQLNGIYGQGIGTGAKDGDLLISNSVIKGTASLNRDAISVPGDTRIENSKVNVASEEEYEDLSANDYAGIFTNALVIINSEVTAKGCIGFKCIDHMTVRGAASKVTGNGHGINSFSNPENYGLGLQLIGTDEVSPYLLVLGGQVEFTGKKAAMKIQAEKVHPYYLSWRSLSGSKEYENFNGRSNVKLTLNPDDDASYYSYIGDEYAKSVKLGSATVGVIRAAVTTKLAVCSLVSYVRLIAHIAAIDSTLVSAAAHMAWMANAWYLWR